MKGRDKDWERRGLNDFVVGAFDASYTMDASHPALNTNDRSEARRSKQ